MPNFTTSTRLTIQPLKQTTPSSLPMNGVRCRLSYKPRHPYPTEIDKQIMIAVIVLAPTMEDAGHYESANC
jgi:hypothetical protein